jgi:hypothetical protein
MKRIATGMLIRRQVLGSKLSAMLAGFRIRACAGSVPRNVARPTPCSQPECTDFGVSFACMNYPLMRG